jgi:plastocyanin
MSTLLRGPGRLLCVPVLLLLAFAVAACGGGGKSSSSAGGVAGTTATLSGHQVVATETEYRIQLSTMNLQPGRTTFVAMNKGHVAHSLEIDGPGVSDKRILGTIDPGSSKQLTVTLQKGSYEIYCPVDGHKQLGMDVHVAVGGGGGAGAGGAAPTTTMTTSGNGY